MKRIIYCFAKDKNSLFSKLENQAEPLIKHFTKYFMYPGHVSSNHWADEIYSFLNSVSKLKRKNKRPTANQILNKTWIVYEDSILEYIPTVVEDYGYSEVDPNVVYENCKKYMMWLCTTLSDIGSVSKKACKLELKSIETEK